MVNEMKRCADLEADVLCPVCGKRSTLLGGLLQFQWGKIPHSYHISDRVVWLTNRAGQVVPSFQLVGPDGLWNCGDPSITDLYVFNGDPNISEFRCSRCGAVFEGVAVHIRGGALSEVCAFLPGQVERRFGATLDTFDIAVALPDGSYEARTDWYDTPFSKYVGQWP
jgi:hypothetical protein